MKPAISNAGNVGKFNFDEAWLARARSTLLGREGEFVKYRLEDPETSRSWISVTARWDSVQSKLLETEYLLATRLETAYAVLPAAMIRSQHGPVLVYDDDPASEELTQVLPLSITDFFSVAVGASAALERLHAQNVLHRDIRPRRICRASNGSIRLSFFGMAGSTDNPDDGSGDPIADELLPYASPEFARRNNSYADERSDLYSLGITFHEFLTGEHPYSAKTASEWLYAHVAFQAKAPSLARPDVPPILDDIILKLIAKDPAQRYQSAKLLHADLSKCQTQWLADKSIENFKLGCEDGLNLTVRLYGRDREFEILQETFERVRRTGEPALTFISGPPGAGKTALAQGLLSNLPDGMKRIGLGKSDQHQRQTPYAPIRQALQTILDFLVGQNRGEVLKAQERLRERLGANARLVADLVPELEFVLGKTAPVPDLPSEAARERMNATLIQALTAFAEKDAPLVLIIDDIQWADSSTWALLRKFSDIGPGNVILIATYRDNEVFHVQDLDALRSAARSNAVNVCDIHLNPLRPDDITQLVSGALRCAVELARPLAHIIHEKTGGNAFFADQFLRALVDEKVISRDQSSGGWIWDAAEVDRRSHTDNVLDLMIRRLERLSGQGRTLMKVLACVGARSDELLLARLLDYDIAALAEAAMPLIEAGLLYREGGFYGFAHDRILESAYSQIPENERARLHARIAVSLIQAVGDTAFESANQVQRAGNLDLDQKTLNSFISTLAAAARRARSAAAIGQAWNYLNHASQLVGESGWTERYSLAYEIGFLRCECLIAHVNLDQAFEEITDLIRQARTPIDLAAGYRLRASVLTLRSDYEGTITSALAGLDLLGISLKRFPTDGEILVAYDAVLSALGGRDISELGRLQTTQDPNIHVAMELLATLLASIFIDDGISFLHVAKMVELTLIHGPTPASAHGLAWFGVFSADRFGAYHEGFAYGEAALDLIGQNGWEGSRPGVLVAVDQVSAWTQPLSYALSLAREASAAGLAGGDLAMACYAGNHIVSDLLCMGHPISSVIQEASRALGLAERIKFKDIERLIAAQLAFAVDLKGTTEPATSMPRTDLFSELGSSAVSQSTLFWEWLYGGMTAFYRRDFEQADKFFHAVGKLTWAVPAHINLSDYNLFAALTLARRSLTLEDTSEGLISEIERHRDKLRTWAEINPSTFLNKSLLVDAEIARLRGDALTAMQLYEASAEAALSSNFLHEYALANELAAAHEQAVALKSTSQNHLRAARNGYRRWGAFAKVTQLEADHPFLAVESPSVGASPASHQPALDVAVAMEVARTLSEEIQIEKLIEKLIRSMVVHAGANYGLLVLIRNEEPVVEAVAELIGQHLAVTSKTMVPTDELVPMTVLNAVVRTRKPILVDDASQTEFASQTTVLSSRSPKSIACFPLIKQGALIGALYLENNLISGVFTPNRTAMLEMLAPQAAICLETARLYAELLEQNERRRQSQVALRTARAELARASHLSAVGGLTASISHEISQPLSSIRSNAEASFRWLQRSVPNIDEALLNVQNIRTDANRATAIVSAIRALAKRSPSTLVPVNIDHLITEVLEITSAELETKHVAVSSVLMVDEALVLGDPVQLQQVILNLVTNASDAMLGLDLRQLVVESSVDNGMIRVAVSDTGSGMSEETKLRIFDPLFTTKESGMGMGMSICRTIVEAHQGTLEVLSTSASGTTIAFKLPMAR